MRALSNAKPREIEQIPTTAAIGNRANATLRVRMQAIPYEVACSSLSSGYRRDLLISMRRYPLEIGHSRGQAASWDHYHYNETNGNRGLIFCLLTNMALSIGSLLGKWVKMKQNWLRS